MATKERLGPMRGVQRPSDRAHSPAQLPSSDPALPPLHSALSGSGICTAGSSCTESHRPGERVAAGMAPLSKSQISEQRSDEISRKAASGEGLVRCESKCGCSPSRDRCFSSLLHNEGLPTRIQLGQQESDVSFDSRAALRGGGLITERAQRQKGLML